MSDSKKIKDCPFCGLSGSDMFWPGNDEEGDLIHHPNNDCVMADVRTWDIDAWNNRAGENK